MHQLTLQVTIPPQLCSGLCCAIAPKPIKRQSQFFRHILYMGTYLYVCMCGVSAHGTVHGGENRGKKTNFCFREREKIIRGGLNTGIKST